MANSFQLEAEFVPRRGLRSPHLQTLAGNFLSRKDDLPKPEERLFRVADGVQVLCHCHWQRERQTAMTLVIVHGLEGSSNSQYVVGTSNKAWQAGMNVVRMNMRNCGGTEHLGPTLYHSGLSADVAAITKTLIAEDSLQRLALAGFSMGGNLVLKCAGEWGESAPPQVRAIVGISPAMDLSASVDALHRWQNRMYEAKFMWGLNRRARRKAALFPQLYQVNGIWKNLRDFDDRFTAPHSGFSGAEDYYGRASAGRVVGDIRIPTLIIHSLDDPFIVMLPETRAKVTANQHICLLETRHGGHCAFLASPNGYDGRWAERTLVKFISQQT